MLILNKFYFNTFFFFFIFVRINQKITINLTTIKMKKLLFTASLLLAFNLSSFANTNGTKIAIIKETKVENVTEYNEEDDCRTITYRWTEVYVTVLWTTQILIQSILTRLLFLFATIQYFNNLRSSALLLKKYLL